MHIFKHCREVTLFLLWIGTYCISCVVQQTSGVKDLSSLVRYDDSSLAAIRHVQSIIPVVRPRPNICSHSVLFFYVSLALPLVYRPPLLVLLQTSAPLRSLACSQTLYFLFKFCQARVIKSKYRGGFIDRQRKEPPQRTRYGLLY